MSIKLRGNARVRRWTSIDNGPNGFQAKKKSKVTEINTIQEIMDVLEIDRRGVFEIKGKKYKLSGALIFGLQLDLAQQDTMSVISEKHKEMQQSLFYEYFMNLNAE